MKKELLETILAQAIHYWRYVDRYWKIRYVHLKISTKQRELISYYIEMIYDDEKHPLHSDLKKFIDNKIPYIYPRYYPTFHFNADEYENLFMNVIGCIITSIYILQVYNKEYKHIPPNKKYEIKKAIALLKKYTKDEDILKSLNSYDIRITKFNKDILMSCIFYELTQVLKIYKKIKLSKTKITKLCNEILYYVLEHKREYRIYKYQLSRYTTKHLL